MGQRPGLQRSQVRRKLLRQWQSQPSRIHRGGDAVHAGRPLLDSASVNRSASSSTSAAGPQHLGERVVLLLGLGHPGQAVEQQRVVVARGQPLQLGARAVQDDDPQRADLELEPSTVSVT